MAVPPTEQPVQACLFDMDGVLRHWLPDIHSGVEDATGMPRGALLAAAFSVPEYEASVVGTVTYGQWCTAIEDSLARDYGRTAARTAADALRADRGQLDPAAVGLVQELRRRLPVVLLSNAHDGLAEDLRHHALDRLFTSVVCSATEGVAKPDPAIYRLAARRAGVAPEFCFFTDDLETNVAAARAVGMRAHHFTGVAALRAELARLGVLDAAPHRPGAPVRRQSRAIPPGRRPA